jgi:D-sedoheptulose 7-phosphate isomerase
VIRKSINTGNSVATTKPASWKARNSAKSAGDSDAAFRQAINDHLQVVQQLGRQQEILNLIAMRMTKAVLSGGKVLWCGNGGSAADCQHLAAELVGRFRRNRRGLASIALTTDSSILTAVGNDYGFIEIFRRQVEALCTPRDVVVGISTSGNSENVRGALEEAKKIGAFTGSFTGIDSGKIGLVSDAALRVVSNDTARIQEVHILAGHILCDWVEMEVCSADARMKGGGNE